MSGNNCVVVLNYNDWQSCVTLIDRIYMYKCINNIIVVDNHSTDDSLKNLTRYFCGRNKVKVIASKRNGGYAYGNNVGCRYAIEVLSAELITIANPDVFFSEDVLFKLTGFLEEKENVGIVGCMMKCMSRIDLPSAWKNPTFYDCILENLMILRKIIGNRTNYDFTKDVHKAMKVDVIAGSLFTISAKTYEEIGGFDTNTFLYYEENILAKRLKRHGYTNYLLTNLEYEHYHSISIDKSFADVKSRLGLAYKSRRYYCEEYLNCGMIRLLALKVTYEIGLFHYIVASKLLEKLRKLFLNRQK